MKLVSPENFDTTHKKFVDAFKDSVINISAHTDIILGAKDIHSRHLIASDAFARLVGLTHGGDVAGRLDRDMPCKGTAQFSDSYVHEDQMLLHQLDINQKIYVLNIHEYSHGIDAFIFEKSLLKHPSSESILGTIYTAHRIEVSKFVSLIPNYAAEFGMAYSVDSINGPLTLPAIQLTDYEYEVCFLFTMNWDLKQITSFMDKHRPKSKSRSQYAIYKLRNRICDKLGCRPSHLRELLVGLGIHQKMPSSFFRRLIGSKLLL